MAHAKDSDERTWIDRANQYFRAAKLADIDKLTLLTVDPDAEPPHTGRLTISGEVNSGTPLPVPTRQKILPTRDPEMLKDSIPFGAIPYQYAYHADQNYPTLVLKFDCAEKTAGSCVELLMVAFDQEHEGKVLSVQPFMNTEEWRATFRNIYHGYNFVGAGKNAFPELRYQ